MVEPGQLVVGESYFMVTYPDPSMATPIVITYRYLGKDPEGVAQDEPGSHYYFRCLPPFQPAQEDDEELRSLAAGWDEAFPGAFTGWGEHFPSSFPAAKLAGLNTLDGLIQELTTIRGRKVSSE
jgi:hypothetical protein